MTKITEEDVLHVAKLARLKIETSEVQTYQNHLMKVLEHMDELKKVNTDGVEPLYSPMRENKEFYELGQNRHEDVVRESLGTNLVLKNAPEKHLNQFKLEAVLEDN